MDIWAEAEAMEGGGGGGVVVLPDTSVAPNISNIISLEPDTNLVLITVLLQRER